MERRTREMASGFNIPARVRAGDDEGGGPLASSQSSRCKRTVSIFCRISGGGWTCGTPDLIDQGPKPARSWRRRTAMERS